MGFWNKIFGSKKKEDTSDIIPKEETIVSPPIILETIPPVEEEKREFLSEICELCNNKIGAEKRKKVGGKMYHKSCIKEQYNKMKSQGKTI